MIKLLGIKNNMFHWSVTIKGEQFDYFTGLGHTMLASKREEKNKSMIENNYGKLKTRPVGYIKSPELSYQNKNDLLRVHNLQLVLWNHERIEIYVKVPKMRDVLYCLALDARSGNQTFESFCDEYGYNQDSRKDFETYLACQKTHSQLMKLRIDIERISQWEL